MAAQPTMAWHWLAEDRRLQYGTRRLVKPGVKMHCKGDIIPCHNGMHASERIIDALTHAPGPVICRVEVGGKIERERDKLAGRWRRVDWMFDATELLHRFACRVAEKALKDANVEDKRCYEAICIKLLWLEGNATDDELDAARSAAEPAAGSAAESAARWAAWWAARSAARWAAESAAESAAWWAQNTILTDMVMAEAKKRGLS